MSQVLKKFSVSGQLGKILTPYSFFLSNVMIKYSLTVGVLLPYILADQNHLINSLKHLESFQTLPQVPNSPIRTTRHFQCQCFWSQKRKIISHFKQVLLWHQKVNSLSLAAFNSQQHFVLGLCQVILGCEIVRNDGWLSAFCYLFLSP